MTAAEEANAFMEEVAASFISTDSDVSRSESLVEDIIAADRTDELTPTSNGEQWIDLPEEFMCPIDMSILVNPHLFRDGKNYSYDAIAKWLRSHTESPITREPMFLFEGIYNREIAERIAHWKLTAVRE